MAKPVLVFFQEVKRGDLLKAMAQSNDADTGGGARDLRMPQAVADRIGEMFPHATTDPGVTQGTINWNVGGKVGSAEVELWRPTDARPGESRIARIPQIRSWVIPRLDLERAMAEGRRLFYVLTLDDAGKVWADVLDEAAFDLQDPGIVQFLKKRMKDTPPHHSVRGIIDFRTGRTYP